jgi:hypothetical protein
MADVYLVRINGIKFVAESPAVLWETLPQKVSLDHLKRGAKVEVEILEYVNGP